MSSQQLLQKPDIKLSVKQTFGFESDMQVGAFSKKRNYYKVYISAIFALIVSAGFILFSDICIENFSFISERIEHN